MISVEGLREHFLLNGYACFDLQSFVPEVAGLAERVAGIDEMRWSYIVKNHDGEHDFSSAEREKAEIQHLIADHDRELGAFSFSFRWIPESPDMAGSDALRVAKRLMGSDCVLDLLRAVTGRRPLAISQCYLSWFESGHFLGTHCDPGQSFGVALSLSRDWDANHGGLTVLLRSDGNAAHTCLVPLLYRLLVFDTSARKIPHFVSVVRAPAHRRRFTVVVRYRA